MPQFIAGARVIGRQIARGLADEHKAARGGQSAAGEQTRLLRLPHRFVGAWIPRFEPSRLLEVVGARFRRGWISTNDIRVTRPYLDSIRFVGIWIDTPGVVNLLAIHAGDVDQPSLRVKRHRRPTVSPILPRPDSN